MKNSENQERLIKSKAIREYLQNSFRKEDINETFTDVARKFNFLEDESTDRRYEAVRSIFRALKMGRNVSEVTLPLRSKWQMMNKEGEVVWLESYRRNHADFIDAFNMVKEDFLQRIVEERSKDRYDLNSPILKDDGVLCEPAIFDFHFGKRDGYTLKEQSEYFIQMIYKLIKRVSSYHINRFVFPIGNDLFHIDTSLYTTTKGTALQTNEEYAEIFKVGTWTLIEAIKLLSSIAIVDVIVVPGNHDTLLSLAAGEVINAYFAHDNRVNVDNSNELRKYYNYGNNLIGYTHGDKEKPKDLPLIMAVEQSKLFAECPNRYWRIGHLHYHESTEFHSVEVRRIPSLTRPDDFHKKYGYLSGTKCMVNIYDKKEGLFGYFQVLS